jgi:hypothetical protein
MLEGPAVRVACTGPTSSSLLRPRRCTIVEPQIYSCTPAMLRSSDLPIVLEALALEHPSLFEAIQREFINFGGRSHQEKVGMIRKVIDTAFKKLSMKIEESIDCDRALRHSEVVFLGSDDERINVPHSMNSRNKRRHSEESVHDKPRIKRNPDASQQVDLTGTNQSNFLRFRSITNPRLN